MCVTREARGVVFLIAVGLTACGGNPPAHPAPATPEATRSEAAGPPPTATVAGRVVDAQSGSALARARVIVTSAALTEPRVALTGPDGRYAISDLPPGHYGVTAVRTGFVIAAFGDTGDAEATPVELAAGQRLTIGDLALPHEGIVGGRILDEDGAPFEGARVELLRPQLQQGQRVLTVIGRAWTDDRGAFRVGGLPPGRYYVSAADPAYDSVGDVKGKLEYSATYHPGVVVPEEAAAVVVEAGRETTAIEFRLRIVRPVSVSGRIAAADGRQLLAGAVTMTAQQSIRLAPVPIRDVVIRPDGAFVFRSVTPGKYLIRARAETERQGVSLFGTFALSVEAGDVQNVAISLTPGAIAEGRLDFDSAGPPPALGRAVRVRAVASDGVAFADALSDVIGPGFQFAFRGIMPGEHVFRVEGLPDPWVLKAVYLRGRDTTDTPVYLDGGQRVQNLTLVVTDRLTSLAGVVRWREGEPCPNATVVVFGVDPGLWRPFSRHVRAARPGLDGSYRLRGLPPGEYWLAATQEVDAADLLDPASLERLVGGASRITLAEGESKVLDVEIAATHPTTGIAASHETPR